MTTTRKVSSGPSLPRITVWGAEEVRESGNHAQALAEEEPLEIRIRGQALTVLMRTPGHDEELTAGVLWSEGIIRDPSELVEVAPCRAEGRNSKGQVINAYLTSQVKLDWGNLGRHLVTGSSCGLCGASSIAAVQHQFPPVAAGGSVAAGLLVGMPEKMRAHQSMFKLTGGVHAAALFTSRGRLIAVREDVGRHNAVDKIIGHAVHKRLLPLRKEILIVSGRVSFEIMQKALSAGIPIIAAVSAPTGLAVEFARSSGQTLVGFLREGRLTVFSHPHRIKQTPKSLLAGSVRSERIPPDTQTTD